jgi:Spy/CpxP family protein refolding chaperone
MKKMFVLVAVTIMSQFAFAQEKQDSTLNRKTPGMFKKHHRGNRHDKSEMMKDLNLSETQKTQLKEMRMANKEKKDAILKDSNLTQEQKKEKMKELHDSNAKGMQSIFTEEQKAKMKAGKAKMRETKQHDPNWKGRKNNAVDSTKQ